MSDSIHTARWISQIVDQSWNIYLFPSIQGVHLHPIISNFTDDDKIQVKSGISYDKLKNSLKMKIHYNYNKLKRTFLKNSSAKELVKFIKKTKPDLIHSLEIQHAGYLTLEAKKIYKGTFPHWAVSNWGSDIFLFGRLNNHKERIKQVLENSDYYLCECTRDTILAKDFGFKGSILPIIPNAGGYELSSLSKFRQSGKTSQRRLIMLKGYQGIFGRGQVALRALELCADLLQNYEIVIYSASNDMKVSAELFTKSTGISVKIISRGTDHIEILRLYGQARISIGLSISDGISTSLLEALVMGSFPIQSKTSCCDEWIENGKNGFIVPPEDPNIVESAIRTALKDDQLVDSAAEINNKITTERLDYSKLKSKVINTYKIIGNHF